MSVRVALVVAAIAGVVIAGSRFPEARRNYRLNRDCCGITGWRNVALTVRESLRLARFPSQTGQDRWVAEQVFPGVHDGFFVDVGSADGFVFSNTWAVERRGWTGICIDPFPRNMGGRTCAVVARPVASVSGRKITFAENGDLGGIKDYLPTNSEARQQGREVALDTVTLADVLAEHHAPSFIHFMSLDIEGAELEALGGFPFDRYRLGSLVVEHNYEEPKRSAIRSLLAAHGYVRARQWMQDDFYLPAGR